MMNKIIIEIENDVGTKKIHEMNQDTYREILIEFGDSLEWLRSFACMAMIRVVTVRNFGNVIIQYNL